jgi:ribonuclease G
MASSTAASIRHKLDNFKYEEEIVKTGKVDQVLNKRWPILVQILKEPISTKGPRLSCELNLPGSLYGHLSVFRYRLGVQKNCQQRRTQTPAYPGRKHPAKKFRPHHPHRRRRPKKVQELHEELMH